MDKLETRRNKLHIEIVRQMLTLATAGFGLVAALAWNSLIQTFVDDYVKKWLPSGGKISSLIIYAAIVTVLAVFVTYQLSKVLRRLEAKEEKK
jgi:hypothetical protein